MGLFSPYKIVTQTTNELHFIETATRKKFLFFFFRVFPFILLILGWRVISIQELPNEFKYALGPLIILIVLLLFFKKYTTEIKISRQTIELKTQRFFSEISNTILINDIEKITLKEMHGRGGGYFFKLRMKDGRKSTFFTIPVLYMREGKLQQINEVLLNITSIEIERN